MKIIKVTKEYFETDDEQKIVDANEKLVRELGNEHSKF
jgi:hypothetical protein